MGSHKKKKFKYKENLTPTPQPEQHTYKPEVTAKSLKDLKGIIIANVPIFAILAFICALIYANTINGQFITGDDMTGIVWNPQVTDLAGSLKTFELNAVHLAVFYKLFGFNPTAFHVRSIIFHTLNTFLVFLLIHILFNKKIALIASLLFAVHPLNTEAVSWISGIPYIFTSIFALIVLISYSIYRQSRNKRSFWISVLAYLLAVAIYRSFWVLTIPIILVILDQFFFEKKINYKNIKLYVPFVIISAIFILLYVSKSYTQRLTFLKQEYYFDPHSATPLLNRTPYTIFMAAKLLIFPLEMSIYTDEGKVITHQYYVAMVITTILFTITAIYLWKKKRIYAGFIFIILASILPSFSPVVIAWFVADRYLYLGTAIFCTMIALILDKLETKYKIQYLTAIAVTILFIMYSIRTVIRNNDWKNSKTLWSSTQITTPGSYRVYNNLGDVYFREGNYQLAIEYFQKSINIYPGFADAVHNLGFTYMTIGDYENARKELLKSYEINPRLYQSLIKLGVIEYNQKNYAKAKEYFQKTLEINPDNVDAKNALDKLNGLGF